MTASDAEDDYGGFAATVTATAVMCLSKQTTRLR